MTDQQARDLAALIRAYYEAYTADLPHPNNLTVGELLDDLADTTDDLVRVDRDEVFGLFE